MRQARLSHKSGVHGALTQLRAPEPAVLPPSTMMTIGASLPCMVRIVPPARRNQWHTWGLYQVSIRAARPSRTEALRRIAELYVIEAEIRGKPPDERRQVRQARSRPLPDDLERWLRTTLDTLSRKSDTAAAILDALKLWPALLRYCDDGAVEIDNSAFCLELCRQSGRLNSASQRCDKHHLAFYSIDQNSAEGKATFIWHRLAFWSLSPTRLQCDGWVSHKYSLGVPEACKVKPSPALALLQAPFGVLCGRYSRSASMRSIRPSELILILRDPIS